MRLTKLFLALLASSFSLCAVAQQTEYATVVAKADGVRSKTISYADLNLQRDEGVGVLYRRIQVASNQVCAQPNLPALRFGPHIRKCESDATGRAVAQVGVPALVMLHAQQAGKPSSTIVAGVGLR